MRKTLKIAVVAATLGASQAFAAEAGLPFEVTQFDRTLPNVVVKAPAERGAMIARSDWYRPGDFAQ